MVLNSEKSYANCFIFITFVVVLEKKLIQYKILFL